MPTRKTVLTFIFVINTLIMIEAARFMLQQIFFHPLTPTESTVTVPVEPTPPAPVVSIPVTTPAPKVVTVPEPIDIEKVAIKPKATPLPPLPVVKVVPKPAPKVEAPLEPVKTVEVVAPPKPIVLAKMTLDSFNESTKRNNVGGFTGTFGGTGGFCLESYQKGNAANVYEEGGYILKLVYNVNNGYAGYYSKLNGADLTKYHKITFLVKGAKGGEVFEIELGDGSNSSKIDIRDYLPYGASTTWQKVSVPFKAFGEVRNWNQMKGNFAIVFEQFMGMPTNSTLYVDAVIFEE